MRIERTLVDLSRLESLNFAEAFFGGVGGELEAAGLVASPSREALPATVARDPRAIGCVVGHREDGSAALIALTFDGERLGHYTLPPETAGDCAEPATESSACVAIRFEEMEP